MFLIMLFETSTRVSKPKKFCCGFIENIRRDPFNQNSNRSDREKRTTSKGGPVFSKLFRLDRTDPLSFGPKFPEILVEWIAPIASLSFNGGNLIKFSGFSSAPFKPFFDFVCLLVVLMFFCFFFSQ